VDGRHSSPMRSNSSRILALFLRGTSRTESGCRFSFSWPKQVSSAAELRWRNWKPALISLGVHAIG